MSEQRIADAVIKLGNAARQGKKPLKIELYRAEQWRHSWTPYKKTMHPHPPLRNRESYWQDHYRLRVDGRWHGRSGYKFSFYTLEEAMRLAEQLHRERP